MSPATKNISGALLLLLSALPVLIATAFIARQQYVQWGMKEALEKEQLSTITIAAQDFKWHKKGKEIMHNKHLFDVKEIKEIRSGVLVITGLYDYQEDALNHQLQNNYKHNHTHAKGQQLLQGLLTIVAIEPSTNLSMASIDLKKALHNSHYSCIQSQFTPSLIGTPPRS